MVRKTPCWRQRRPEVVTRWRRQSGRPSRFSLAEAATSSISAIGGKPPIVIERRAGHEHGLVAGRDAARPRAPVHHEGDHVEPAAIVEAHVEAAPGAFACAPIRRRSACRRCRAAAYRRAGTAARRLWRQPRRRSSGWRVRAALRSRGRRKVRARATVSSLLPPSTTITSDAARAVGCERPQGSSMPAASFSTGMTMESVIRRLPAQRNNPVLRRYARNTKDKPPSPAASAPGNGRGKRLRRNAPPARR